MGDFMADYRARAEADRERLEAEAAERTAQLEARTRDVVGDKFDPDRFASRGKDNHVEVLPAERTPAEEQTRKAVATRAEADMVDGMRTNAARATEIEAVLLERALEAQGKEVAGALRAVADVKAKSVDGLLKLTGRAPSEEGSSIESLLRSLAKDGLVRLNVNLDVGSQEEVPPS